MTAILSSEKNTLLFYLLCVVATPFILNHVNSGYVLCGWGIFGLYRFIYLNDSISQKIPKILNLPSRILFGFNQEKKIYVEKIMRVYNSKYFIGGVLIFMLYALWVAFMYYAALGNVPLDGFVDASRELVHYAYLSKLITVLIIALITALGVSFSQIKQISLNN